MAIKRLSINPSNSETGTVLHLLFIYMLNFSLAPHVTTSNISIWHSHSGFRIHKSRSRKPTPLCLTEVTGDRSWICANKAWATQENMAGIHTGINTAAYISIKNHLVRILLPKNTQPSKLVNISVTYGTIQAVCVLISSFGSI